MAKLRMRDMKAGGGVDEGGGGIRPRGVRLK